jgi:alkylation response protein AidB-like acyl-CoA dehydrogenase
MANSITAARVKGGAFLLQESDPQAVFTPEDYTEEQRMLRQAMRDFLAREVEPLQAEFDSVAGTQIAPRLLEKMGALGFHGIGVPEEFGGMDGDFKTELAVGEVASDSFAFAQSVGVHTSLGIYPLLLYGNQEQKARYLHKIVTAEIKCAYCLTEPGAGSDANSGKTRAIYSPDRRHFILNGQKMWITNSGFADVFFVFCKIEDDDSLSCLIVHKEWGVTLGAEERKLGIHGSSTRQVFFENVRVPVENLLGERNQGFKIAMNALNAGRIKISVANTAIAKRAFRLGLQYAKQRVQFGQPIAQFGAIQHKIATMAARLYANESAWNRIAHQIDEAREQMAAQGMSPLEAKYRSVAEFAIECAMVKVYGSEMEQYVVDEALQIHGGMGYSAESEISTHYRNIRGNRIYEGTNEINRMLVPATLLRKAMKGELALLPATYQALEELQGGKLGPIEGLLEQPAFQQAFLQNAKKFCLLVMGQAVQAFQQNLKEEQEVLLQLADMLIQVFLFESAWLRSQKQAAAQPADVRHAITTVLLGELAERLRGAAREVIGAAAPPEAAAASLGALERLIRLPAYDFKNCRRRIAAHFIAKNEYGFDSSAAA